MSAAGSSPVRKLVDTNAHEETIPSTPLMSTLTEIVKILLRATQNREFATDSHFALDTLRQAVKITQTYITHLQQELERHGTQLATDGHDRVNEKSNATTLLARLGKLVRDLARTREQRPNGSVRLTLLGEVYGVLAGEMRGARKEVKRLEHLLEGKHTRKRHRRHRNFGAEEGFVEVGGGSGEAGDEVKSGVSSQGASQSAGPLEAQADHDAKPVSPPTEELTRAYPEAVGADSRTSDRSIPASSRGSRSLAEQNSGKPRSSNISSRHTAGSAIVYSSLLVEDLVTRNGYNRSVSPASSRRSPTVYTLSGSETSSKKSDTVRSAIESTDKTAQPQSGDPYRLSQPASQTSEHSSVKPGSKLSSHRSPAARPICVSSLHSKRSESRSTRSGSAVATLGTGSKDRISSHESLAKSKRIDAGSAVVTASTGSQIQDYEHEGESRGESPAIDFATSDQSAHRKGKQMSEETASADGINFHDRPNGGWSFEALQSDL